MRHKIKILGIGICLFIVALSTGGRLTYLLLYAYLATLLIPFCHGVIGKIRLEGSVEIPNRNIVSGQTITMKYRIQNKSKLAFPVILIQNTLVQKLSGKFQEEQISLDGEHSFQGEVEFVCKRRGIYELGEIQLLIWDIFGIFQFKKRIKGPISLKVYPSMEEIRYLAAKASRQMGEMQVKDPLFQDPSELFDLRPYRMGDPIKKIHWKASSKGEDILVKNFERRGDTELVLLLDTDKRGYELDSQFCIEDKIVETAASIVNYALKRGMKIKVLYRQAETSIKIQGDSVAYLNVFLDALIAFHPLETLEMEKQILLFSDEIQQGSTFFVLTPWLNKKTGTQGLELRNRNVNPSFILVTDNKENLTQEAKGIMKTLEADSIPCYVLDVKEEIQDEMEARDEGGKKA